MAQRFKLEISDDLLSAIDEVCLGREMALADVLRNALQLYLASHRGVRQGLMVGLVDKKTNQMVTEFVGL